MKTNNNNSLEIIFWRCLSLFLFILLSPLFLILSSLILIFSGWPILFIQKRTGYKGKPFKIYKFRTMVNEAENIKKMIANKNEAKSPVFKIYNDPRFTKIGGFLCHTGLDELPQLLNIIKGEMLLIGPRPLPIDEAVQIEKKYRIIRQSVLPGIISPWVLIGYHNLSFNKWMKLDIEYIKNKSFIYDCKIFIKGIILIVILFKREIYKNRFKV